MIVSGSTRILESPSNPVLAVDRFDGVFARQIRKHRKHLRGIDIWFISCDYGLIKADEKIKYKPSISSNWAKPTMNCEDVSAKMEQNRIILQRLFSKTQYSEVYVNVGKEMMQLLPALSKIIPDSTKITYSCGRGIGPKMAHMKQWIEMQKR